MQTKIFSIPKITKSSLIHKIIEVGFVTVCVRTLYSPSQIVQLHSKAPRVHWPQKAWVAQISYATWVAKYGNNMVTRSSLLASFPSYKKNKKKENKHTTINWTVIQISSLHIKVIKTWRCTWCHSLAHWGSLVLKEQLVLSDWLVLLVQNVQ